MRRTLAIDKKSLGPGTPQRHDLPSTIWPSCSRPRTAWPRPEAADASLHSPSTKSLGPEHPTVAIRLNNLAQLLQATNRLSEAEPLMRRALAIDEASFGADHPNVAIRLNNLAQLLKDTNRLAEAEPLMRRALAIDEKRSFGDETPQGRDRPSTIWPRCYRRRTVWPRRNR